MLCSERADEQVTRPVLKVPDAAVELVNLRSTERWRFIELRCARGSDRGLAGRDEPSHADDDAIVPTMKSIRRRPSVRGSTADTSYQRERSEQSIPWLSVASTCWAA